MNKPKINIVDNVILILFKYQPRTELISKYREVK